MDFPNATHGRLVHAGLNAFWEWEVQGRTSSTTSGRLGKAGRKTAKTLAKAQQAASDLDARMYKKLKEGFQLHGSEAGQPILFQTWLTSASTGFESLDIDGERDLIAAARHTGNGGRLCEVVVMDVATGAVQRQIELEEFDVWELRFFDADLLLQVDDRVLRLDPRTGAMKVLANGGMFPFLVFDSQAGRLLCSTAGSAGVAVQVIDLQSGRILLDVDANEQHHVADHRIRHQGALSRSGKLAALCRRPGEIEVYDIKTGKQRLLRGEFPCAAKLQFHPSDRWLAFSEQYGDWRFRLWRVDRLKEDTRFDSVEYAYPNGAPRMDRVCYDFAFSPDGKTLALRDNDWIRLHEFDSGKVVARIQQRHVARSWGTSGFRIVYASDGRLLTRTDRGIVTVYRDVR